MTREEIIALAKECGVTHRTWDYQDKQAIEAFYHATQRQAYERAAEVCERLDINGICHTNYPEEAFPGDCATEIRALIEGDGK